MLPRGLFNLLRLQSAKPTSKLDIPQAVKNKFDSQGMTLRWIRVALNGEDDYKNVGNKELILLYLQVIF